MINLQTLNIYLAVITYLFHLALSGRCWQRQWMIIQPIKRNSESKEKFRLSNSFSTHENWYRNYYFMRVKAFLIKTGFKIRRIYRLCSDIDKVFFLFINYRSILWLITDTGVFLTQNYLWYPKINHHKVKKISWNVWYLCSISSYQGLTALLFEIAYFIYNIF